MGIGYKIWLISGQKAWPGGDCVSNWYLGSAWRCQMRPGWAYGQLEEKSRMLGSSGRKSLRKLLLANEKEP